MICVYPIFIVIIDSSYFVFVFLMQRQEQYPQMRDQKLVSRVRSWLVKWIRSSKSRRIFTRPEAWFGWDISTCCSGLVCAPELEFAIKL